LLEIGTKILGFSGNSSLLADISMQNEELSTLVDHLILELPSTAPFKVIDALDRVQALKKRLDDFFNSEFRSVFFVL
jgi:hypothetical protein